MTGIVLLIAQESEGVPAIPIQVQCAPTRFAGKPYVELLYGERVIGMRTLVRDELCIQGGLSSPAVIEEPHDATPVGPLCAPCHGTGWTAPEVLCRACGGSGKY